MSRQNPYHNPYDIIYGPEANCTLSKCDVRASIFQYQPSRPANAIFIALFGLSMVIHIIQGVKWRTWAFMTAMIWGCVTEMIGYGGRIIMHGNPFSFSGFIIEVVCITIAPAFYSAAIYITLSQSIRYVGVKWSLLRPSLYYWYFISCDIVSLTLQGTGGAMSSESSGSSKVGINIALAGLSFQVFTLTVFLILAIDYGVRYWRNQDDHMQLETSFKVFVGCLSLATVLIFTRCVYRIAELSEGYSGELIHDQGLFIGLEGALVLVATFALNTGHPGPVFNKPSLLPVQNSEPK